MKTRQKIRLGLVLISFFLFPATYYYFSPYLIVDGAIKGIANGSFIVFTALFLSALVVGRAFCGWICPAAGCQEALQPARSRRVTKGNFIKWIIWIPWVCAIAALAFKAGGYQKVDFLYQTRYGLSIADYTSLITYLLVLLLILIPALAVGRRSFCHHLCWMSPFMIIGRSLRNAIRLPSLQLKADPGVCKSCHRCTEGCPMSLPVEAMVQKSRMENAECILCGTCVDNCRQGTIRFSFGRPRT